VRGDAEHRAALDLATASVELFRDMFHRNRVGAKAIKEAVGATSGTGAWNCPSGVLGSSKCPIL
jgi:hypothetical protein